MKNKLVTLLFVTPMLLAGCATTSTKPDLIAGADNDEYGGADVYANLGDHSDSLYWNAPDFYNMSSDENLTIISHYQPFLQTTEYSCGPASLLTILNHFGLTGYDEMSLAIDTMTSVDEDTEGALPGSADNFYEYGANVKKIYDYASTISDIEILETSYVADYTDADLISATDGYSENDVGNLFPTFSALSLYASENSDTTDAWVSDAKDSFFVQWVTNHLKANHPIMVEWGDWDGHWQVIIGYDTIGTPGLGDDVIIFADTYDTSDHWQDGYYFYPAERWFYMWQDRNIAPKPYQLQPYLVFALND